MNPDGPSSPRRDRTGLALVLILLLSAGVFAPSLLNGFTLDDPHYARTTTSTGEPNPMVATLHPFWEYWRRPMNEGLNNQTRSFRPVTVFSYALVNAWAADPVDPGHATGDDRAWAQHLLNLLLHAAVTLCVFHLLRERAGRIPALLAAMVFGVHAIHSGPVAAIVGRGELLACLGGCAAALLYRAGLRSAGKPRAAALTGAAAAFLLGLGGKESGIAWAVFIPLLAAVSGHRWRTQLRPAALAIGVPALAFLLLRHEALATYGRGPFWVEYDANPLYSMPAAQRIANATCILLFGLGKTVLPFNLSSNYGDGAFTLIDGVWHWRFLGASLLLVALVVGAVRVRHRHPLLFLAAAAFFGFTFVTSNIPIPIESIFGDRHYYTPVLGLACAVAWVARVHPPRWRVAAAVLLGGWTLWNAVLGVSRSRAWYDNATLTRTDLQSQPSSVGLHLDMGNALLWNFDPRGARAEFRKAVELNPQSPRALRICAEHTPDHAEAWQLLQRALASPHLVEGTEGRRVHWALGQLEDRVGDRVAARASYLRALECNPFAPDIRLHLLRETAAGGEWELFDRLLDDGLHRLPAHPPFEMYHAVRLAHKGQRAEAAGLFARVLPGLPEQVHVVECWLRHAECLLAIGEPARARGIALRFEPRTRDQPDLHAQCARLLERTATAGPPR